MIKMRESTKAFILAGVCSIFVGLSSWMYSMGNNVPNADKLKTTVSYVQQYDGDDREHVFDAIDNTLKSVGQHEAARTEKFSELETGLLELRGTVTEETPESLYRPAIESYTKKMGEAYGDMVEHHAMLPFMVVGTMGAGLSFGLGIASRYDNN